MNRCLYKSRPQLTSSAFDWRECSLFERRVHLLVPCELRFRKGYPDEFRRFQAFSSGCLSIKNIQPHTPLPGLSRCGLYQPPPTIANISEFSTPTRHAKRWKNVEAGEILEREDGTTCRVVAVRLYLARGGDDCDEVVSGEDWLATGRVLKPGR